MSSAVIEAAPAALRAVPDDPSHALAQYLNDHLTLPRPDCLIWTGDTDRGYGKVQVDGVTKRVHRVVWQLKNGPIPDGLTIDHLCRVRPCCNTDHMELVTAAENVRRGFMNRYGRREWTHCGRGHEFTPENTYTWSGGRACRACRKLIESAKTARRRAAREAARASP